MRVDIGAPCLRVGLGLSVVSPWGGQGVTATTFKIGTGLYLIVIAMLSYSIGGYIAGRLRARWVGVHSDEVYFRDTAHGFVAWAFASVIGAVLLATLATSLVSGGVSALGQALRRRQAVRVRWTPMSIRCSGPIRRPRRRKTVPADSRAEMARLFTSSFRNGGELKPNDRTYVSKVVASQTGLSQADADKRVNDTVTQIKADADAAQRPRRNSPSGLPLRCCSVPYAQALPRPKAVAFVTAHGNPVAAFHLQHEPNRSNPCRSFSGWSKSDPSHHPYPAFALTRTKFLKTRLELNMAKKPMLLSDLFHETLKDIY